MWVDVRVKVEVDPSLVPSVSDGAVLRGLESILTLRRLGAVFVSLYNERLSVGGGARCGCGGERNPL